MLANGTEHRGKRGFAWLAQHIWSIFQRPLPSPDQRNGEAASSHEEFAQSPLQPLRCVRLTDGVARTLFEEYAEHRRGDLGSEETGWVLLGLRERDEAIGIATLPAGTQRDAGIAHVRFNSQAQAVGSRIVRQQHKRLTILGVVHTHPGSLRHPSDGDYDGDSQWVRRLRGGEGIFGIGTADGPSNFNQIGRQPKPNVQTLAELSFSWYSLAAGERQYRSLPVELTLGSDLARPLHDVWPVLEEHADRLDRLYRQQSGLKCEVIAEESGPVLAVTVPLAEAGDCVRVILRNGEPRYLVSQGGDLFAVDPDATSIDRGIYLLLAELAARA